MGDAGGVAGSYGGVVGGRWGLGRVVKERRVGLGEM